MSRILGRYRADWCDRTNWRDRDCRYHRGHGRDRLSRDHRTNWCDRAYRRSWWDCSIRRNV